MTNFGSMFRLEQAYGMTIQTTTQIGTVIRDAVSFDAKNWHRGTMNADSLVGAVRDFFDVLEHREIDYVLVGGIAILHYVDGRNTQDLDLLMAASALEQLPELEIADRDTNFIRAHFNELRIDLLLTNNPLFKKVHGEYSRIANFLEHDIPIATVEGLLLLKLYALPSVHRQGNFARVGLYENDIATLLHYYQPNVPALFRELSNYVNGDEFAKLKAVIADIQQRIERFDAGSR